MVPLMADHLGRKMADLRDIWRVIRMASALGLY